MNFNFLSFSFLIILSIGCVNATQIDIIYPNENITTDIYYSTGDNMFSIQNNTLTTTEDITYLLIKNQYESDDIISDPVKILEKGTLIFWVVMLISLILFLVLCAKRLFK